MEPSHIADGNAEWYMHFGKQFDGFLKKLKLYLSYNSAILILGIYARETKTYIHTKTYMQMIIAVFFHDHQKLGNNPNVHQ